MSARYSSCKQDNMLCWLFVEVIVKQTAIYVNTCGWFNYDFEKKLMYQRTSDLFMTWISSWQLDGVFRFMSYSLLLEIVGWLSGPEVTIFLILQLSAQTSSVQLVDDLEPLEDVSFFSLYFLLWDEQTFSVTTVKKIANLTASIPSFNVW